MGPKGVLWARPALRGGALIALVAALFALASALTPANPRDGSSMSPAFANARIFTNPIVSRGQDPSVAYVNGYYYLVQSNGSSITIARSPSLPEIGHSATQLVAGPICCEVWAPELLELGGRWYIYYSASSATESHRMYVLGSVGADPMGPYTFVGEIAARTDEWAIDGTVLTVDGIRYFVWSGWEETQNTGQNLYIARMSNPWTLAEDRHMIATPTESWERAQVAPAIGVEEGPEALYHDGRVFLVYSANGSWTDNYCLGMLTYLGGDPTSQADWRKSPGCVFAQNPAAGVYGPGHNSFAPSPDGSQEWLIYHADSVKGGGWSDRSIRMQRIRWNSDGSPDFGRPVPTTVALGAPSDQPPPEAVATPLP